MNLEVYAEPAKSRTRPDLPPTTMDHPRPVPASSGAFRPSRAAGTLLGLLVALACQPPETEPGNALQGEPPHRFDAASVRPGMRIAGLEVAEVDLRQSVIDATFVGSVRFRGATTVGGTPFLLDDDSRLLCFLVGPDSAAHLPRLRHDDRRPWFCFDDQDHARARLEPLLDRPVRVVIADFRTVYEFTDAFDTATLVAVEQEAATPSPTPPPAPRLASGRMPRGD
jgi:hypothetical protein